jgi:hypothetical protein
VTCKNANFTEFFATPAARRPRPASPSAWATAAGVLFTVTLVWLSVLAVLARQPGNTARCGVLFCSLLMF